MIQLGGQDGLRGYLYQGVVAIIKALNSEGWNYISVEYQTGNDKVDIALLDSDRVVSAIQVKSSINLFEKRDVMTWIEQITDDVESSVYEIYLLGNPKEDTNIFINSISQYYNGVITKKMLYSLGNFVDVISKKKINVTLLPINQDFLVASVRDILNQYIGKKGYEVSFSILDSLTKMIIGADMLLATRGQKISKAEYDERIFEWLNLSCGNGLKTENSFACITACFYWEGVFSESINPINFRDLSSYKKYIEKQNDTIRKHIDIMCNLDVNAEDVSYEIDGKTYTPIKETELTAHIPGVVYKVDGEIVEVIENIVSTYLNIQLDKSFWDFGDLMKKKVIQGKDYLVGTVNQKRKEQLLWELLPKLSNRVQSENYASAFENVSILPLVIRNNGSIANQKVMITIKIPKKKITPFNYDDAIKKLCPSVDVAKGIIESDITRNMWIPIEDENIRWEGISFIYNDVDTRVLIHPDSLQVQKEKILKDLEFYTKYETSEDEDYIIVKTEVDNIRPDENIALEKYLIFRRIEAGTVIKYSIISQNIPKKIEGELFVG